MMQWKAVGATALCLVGVTLLGCGPKYDTVPVEGQLTYDGQPVAGMIVQFQPETGRASQAQTAEDGSFEMAYTMDQMGVVPGKYTITVSWSPPSDEDGLKPSEEAQKVLDDFKANGPIEVTIEEPQDNFEIKLPR